MQNMRELTERLKRPGTLASILNPTDFADEDQVAAAIAKGHKDDLKPTQTRRIFHAIKQIEHDVRRFDDSEVLCDDYQQRLKLLAPQLAYAVGRGLIPRDFYDVLKLCLQAEKLVTVGDLRRLVQFVSAVVAYQKFYSKDNTKG